MIERAFNSVWWRWLVLGLLLALRLPSLVHPAGADQSLYAYIGLRILDGGAPYLDGWDQKPPGIHVLYALLWWLWPDERVVALADLAAAIVVSGLLVRIGTRLANPAAGWLAAWTFALLANPAMHRLSGVFIRSQCETFIALAVTAALALAIGPVRRERAAMGAGLLLGLAIWLKYNAVVFALPVLIALHLRPAQTGYAPWTSTGRDVAALVSSAAVVGAIGLAWLAWHGALEDLWLATFTYNLHYSSEPFAGPGAALGYLLTLPFRQARYDLLWWLGMTGVGLGLFQAITRRGAWLAGSWIAAAVAAIVLNGRDLPQYFVQAAPALALAAGVGLVAAWQSRQRVLQGVAVAVLAIGFWRIGIDTPVLGLARLGGLPGLVDNLRFDVAHWRGRIDRSTYLDRFGGLRERDKYAALDVETLVQAVRQTTGPEDTIYVFGFSPGVYVNAERRSASRFFWSYPVVIGFEAGRPGYGARGVLDDLRAARPALVALQRHDWDPVDSNSFFMSDPGLSAWLRDEYEPAGEMPRYVLWRRVEPNPAATTP